MSCRARLNATTTATSLTAISPLNHAATVNITVAPPTGGVHGNASQHEVTNSSKGLPLYVLECDYGIVSAELILTKPSCSHAELEAVAYNGAPLINSVLRWGINRYRDFFRAFISA